MNDDDREASGRRFEPDREHAERRYSAALVALDAASQASPTVAQAAATAAADVARLNQIWQQHAPPPGDRSLGGRFRRVIAELARLLPWRRRRLHGALIAAVNRNTESTRALIDATQHFHAHVVWYAQTVAAIASAPRRGEGDAKSLDALHHAFAALSADWLQHWESLAVREQRYAAHTAALTKAYDELREVAALAQQGTLSLKRTVESMTARERPGPPAPASTAAPDPDAFKYVVFEDRFRGTREEIRERLQPYPPLFAGATNVVDVGCGRGELLDLLREQGVVGRGIDVNEEMVAACRARGLTADRADALTFLQDQPDGSLGGLIAIQVVEHLEPAYLARVLETAHHKLKPGAPLVLETINAACWAAFFDSYIRDLTHARPLHPDTLRYLVQASGFATVDVRFLTPVSENDRLPSVKITPEARAADTTVSDLIEAVNAHADRLNRRLFTHRDYAVIARR